PEHGPVGVDGVTYDQQLCWDLFNNTIEAAGILGVDADFSDMLKAKRDRLLGPQIGRWGQLQEWMEDIDDPKDDHRHINHMIGVYPGRRIHPATTPELAEAAKVGLIARRDHGQGHPGWSRVWKACIFARLLDGDVAYEQLVETIATHVHGNLWAVHPPFQIDANFGYAAGVNEMLVQSHLGTIDLLPALPAAWPEGEATGLRIRGGYALDLAWKDGKLTCATLHGLSNQGQPVSVRYGDATIPITLAPGKSHTLVPVDFRKG
ncbi:MAG TPA: glycoside hydrolase family 95, partial [Verrucomicrobia bacterium]|nr:glycoside hydrolase family 95 [Verrucomicrobiota bacterium]